MTALPSGPPHDARALDRHERLAGSQGVALNGRTQVYATCPLCNGADKLSLGIGDDGWPKVNCFTCPDASEDDWYGNVRAALVAAGAPGDVLQPATGEGGRRASVVRLRPRAGTAGDGPDAAVANEEQVEAWSNALWSNKAARQALADAWHLSEATLVQADVGWNSRERRYTFPVADEAGRAVNVLRRSLTDKHKVKTGHDTSGSYVYAPFPLDLSEPVLLCAGEHDALSAYEAGLTNVVAFTNGEKAVPPAHRLDRLRGASVVIAYDNDEAGRTGAARVAAALSMVAGSVAIANLSALGLPAKGDLTDALRSHGLGAVEQVLSKAKPWEGGQVEAVTPDGPRLFTRVLAAELAADPPKMTWTAQGLLVDPTYGVIAGEQKTLKTYLALFIALGVASGTSVFGEFAVVKPRPVHLYVGEGGRVPFQRRLHRVAEGLGLDVARLPFSASFETAPLLSSEFQSTLGRDLADLGSEALFILDPLYAFHGSEVDAGNLYKRGAMLTAFSAPVAEAGASALLVDHFTKTGSGTDLNRIQQTGVQQWADTWILLRHRAAPDVEGGTFSLGVTVGSRQWGGAEWSLDLNLGRLDPDLSQHDGAVTWDLRRGHEADQRGAAKGDAVQKALEFLRSRLGDEPWQHTKTDLETLCGGNAPKFREAWEKAVADGLLMPCNVRRVPDGGARRVQRTVWAKAGEALPEDAESSDV